MYACIYVRISYVVHSGTCVCAYIRIHTYLLENNAANPQDPKCRLRLDEIASHPFLKNSAQSSYMALNQNRNVSSHLFRPVSTCILKCKTRTCIHAYVYTYMYSYVFGTCVLHILSCPHVYA